MGNVNQKPVILVTGTQREAGVVSPEGMIILAGGGDAQGLRHAIAEAAAGAAGIISFGMAGALDRSLALGDWVIGRRVVGGYQAPCDERWIAALQVSLPRARVGAVYADGQLLSDSQSKGERSCSSAALACDMESHIAGEVAAQAGVPFAILRCISDTAETDLPPAVGVMMRPDGGINLGALLRSVAGQPGQVPRLASTLAGFARAFRAMGKDAGKIGGRLGFDQR